MQKIKQFIANEKGKDVLIILIVVLVGIGSFLLGRLSKSDPKPGIKIEYLNQEANAGQTIEYAPKTDQNTNLSFFASNRGTKYYPAGCTAGNNIKQENKIYFGTREEAERAGYELSTSCN